MEKTIKRPVALTLAILGAVARLLPHPPNFTPVGGASLFAGARLPGWLAYLLPILVMAATDPLLGGYSRSTPYVYASFLISVWIGRRLQATENPVRIGGAALLCSLQFFFITNFGVFLRAYPHTWAGFMKCYTLALPFFGRTLAGDLITTAVLFGLHAWLSRAVFTEEQVSLAQA